MKQVTANNSAGQTSRCKSCKAESHSLLSVRHTHYSGPVPTRFTGDAAYDAEVNLWVCRQAEAAADEIRSSKFRRGFLKRKPITRTIFDRYGRPICKVKVNDSGIATEHEFDNHQDAVVRPEPVIPDLLALLGK